MPELLDLLPAFGEAAGGIATAGADIAAPAGLDLAAAAGTGAGAAGAAGGLDLAGSLSGPASGLASAGADFGTNAAVPSNAIFTSGQGNLSDMFISGQGIDMVPNSPQGGNFGAAAGDVFGASGGATPGVTPAANPLTSLDPLSDVSLQNTADQATAFNKTLPAGGGSGNLVSDLVSGATNQLTKNPFGIAAAGGGLALNLLKGNPTDPALAQEQQLASGANAQARQMTSYLASGTLPPGLQTAVDQAVAAQKARIVANHAAQGQPTDPTQNSALAQELSSIDLNATAQIAQIATQLYTQGVNMLNIDAGLLDKIYQADQQQNQQVSGALTNFAKALAPSTNMNLVKVA